MLDKMKCLGSIEHMQIYPTVNYSTLVDVAGLKGPALRLKGKMSLSEDIENTSENPRLDLFVSPDNLA